MKLVAILGGAAIIAGGIYLHGPLQPNDVYNRSAGEAYEILRNTQPPQELIGQTSDSAVKTEHVPQKSVTWHFMMRGKELGSFTAEVASVGDTQARVSTDFTLSDDAKLLALGTDGGLPALESLAEIVKVAMNEQVDSRLDGREFASAKVEQAAAAAFVATVSNIRRAPAARTEEYDKEAVAELEARPSEVTFKPGEPMVSGKPMIDPSR